MINKAIRWMFSCSNYTTLNDFLGVAELTFLRYQLNSGLQLQEEDFRVFSDHV
jgi:hypothetical protein